jgi:hypothetical protein
MEICKDKKARPFLYSLSLPRTVPFSSETSRLAYMQSLAREPPIISNRLSRRTLTLAAKPNVARLSTVYSSPVVPMLVLSGRKCYSFVR